MQSLQTNVQKQQASTSFTVQKAKRMSIDEIEKKQNRSQSIQNSLSSSIARAKEKIQMMEQRKNPKDYRDSITNNKSVQKKENKDSSNIVRLISQPNNEQAETARSKEPLNKMQTSPAVVNVVKSLQIKITELQRLNESIQRERKIMTKQLNNVSQQKRLLLESMEQVKKKNIHLEHTIIKSTKQQIKQLEQKVQTFQTENLQLKNQIKQLELKLKQEHQSHLSIQKSNEKKLKEKKQEEKSSQKNQMIYVSKIKETQQYERNLHVKQKEIQEKQLKLHLKWKELFEKEEEITKKQKMIQQKQTKNYDELVRHNQTMNLANQVRKQLEDKNAQLKKLIEEDKKKIKGMQSLLDEEKKKNSEMQFTMSQMYIGKIQDLEEQLQSLKQTHRHNSKSKLATINKNDKIEALKDELVQVTQQYDQLFTRFKKNEQKLEKEQRQSKNYRSKFWKLKQIIAEISQKASKMPNAIHSQLKLLIVKANKLQSYEIQKSSLSNIYGTPNKKSRSSSIQNKSTSKLSKERSSSKQKTINLTYLDSSRKSNTSAKSKRSMKSDRSNQKKKQVIMSTTNKALLNETQIKISSLQRQIQGLKSTYKKLVEIMNQRNDEQTRNQLNNLVFELQQKSEELTKLKKQKKQKKL